jgi:hypothetical protein
MINKPISLKGAHDMKIHAFEGGRNSATEKGYDSEERFRREL